MPSKFTVIHDSIGSNLTDIETLTLKLCHLYFNVCGSVKVPAPILYAQKLVNLIAEKNPDLLDNGPLNKPISVHDSI